MAFRDAERTSALPDRLSDIWAGEDDVGFSRTSSELLQARLNISGGLLLVLPVILDNVHHDARSVNANLKSVSNLISYLI